jgi:hypothetical protein
MEDISKKLAELDEAAKKLPLKGTPNPSQEKIDASNELNRIIGEIESSLDKRYLPQIVDEKAFLIEKRSYLTLEWFLFKDSENRIKVLYKETPTPAAKGTEYKLKKEEKSVFEWNLRFTKLIIGRLPAFIELIIKESKKYQR